VGENIVRRCARVRGWPGESKALFTNDPLAGLTFGKLKLEELESATDLLVFPRRILGAEPLVLSFRAIVVSFRAIGRCVAAAAKEAEIQFNPVEGSAEAKVFRRRQREAIRY
jgi:hypothetical protein